MENLWSIFDLSAFRLVQLQPGVQFGVKLVKIFAALTLFCDEVEWKQRFHAGKH